MYDDVLVDRVACLRAASLPNETGGVLIGTHDLSRRIVYVVDVVPSPPDSEEWPTLYIRGAEGLKDEVMSISDSTAGSLGYVGEWHTHPDGAGILPSADDRKVFAWVSEHLVPDGYPPLIAIVGQDRVIGWYLTEIDQ